MKHWIKVIEDAHNFLKGGYDCDELNRVLDQMKRQHEFLLPDWKKLDKPIMTVDFDGVIAEYKNGWQGAHVIDEEPIEGAFNFLADAVEHFHVLIFSSRCNHEDGIEAMISWFVSNGLGMKTLAQLRFQPGKPSAFVMIDDRAIHFHGLHGDAKEIFDSFAPWYYDDTVGWRKTKENL